MYHNLAVLSIFLLLYTPIAGLVERSWFSGPIVFTIGGLLLGPLGFDLLHLNIAAGGLRLLAEATLAMVLFTDAAKADFRTLRSNFRVPARLLLVGLPLTIVLGIAVGRALFPELSLLEVGLLATMLAPTDAALGKPVVSNPSVPAVVRESLNVESGLNDGICVPVLVILLGLAAGTHGEGGSFENIAMVVAEEIGIGLAVGLALTAAAVRLLRWTEARDWLSEVSKVIFGFALAAGCFAVAQALGGSGFIACFAGGLLFGRLTSPDSHALLRGADATGETLALLTWLAFGAAAVAIIPAGLTGRIVLYAILSLTVIRMLPVALSLVGTKMGWAETLFIGWFGPRGLASIVFAVMVYGERLPGHSTLMVTTTVTVLLSVLIHGHTANPFTGLLSRRHSAGRRQPESGPVT